MKNYAKDPELKLDFSRQVDEFNPSDYSKKTDPKPPKTKPTPRQYATKQPKME